MAATLLELVIPASVSVVVACVTVVWTTVSNRALEKEKKLENKKEELYLALSRLAYSAKMITDFIYSGGDHDRFDVKEAQRELLSSMAIIELANVMYFNGVDVDAFIDANLQFINKVSAKAINNKDTGHSQQFKSNAIASYRKLSEETAIIKVAIVNIDTTQSIINELSPSLSLAVHNTKNSINIYYRFSRLKIKKELKKINKL